MAYIDQKRKAALAPNIKAVCKKYGVKSTIAVRNHLSLSITIKSGKLDFIKDYNATVQKTVPADSTLTINQYWYKEHFTGKCKQFFEELFAAANDGNHDRSDIMTDYFDVGWYVDINVGAWKKPYEVVR